jgi:hypothetical protein
MRPPMPMAYGVPVMVPFPVYALPTGFDQDEDGGDDRRERAYPPSGPRLFQSQGNPAGPTNGRRAGRDRAAWGNQGRFEVHHPDGTVEVGHDEPMIEELDDHGEVAVQEDDREDTSIFEGNSMMLRLENVPQANTGLDDFQPTPSSSSLAPTLARSSTSPPSNSSDDHNPLERCVNPTLHDAEKPQPIDERRASSGIQAPCHTPEAAPFSTLMPETTSARSVHGAKISPVFHPEAEDGDQEAAIQPKAGDFTRTKGHTRRLSADSEVTRRQKSIPDNIMDEPCPIAPGSTTPQKMTISSNNAGLDSQPSPRIGISAASSMLETAKQPLSASLPSPEAAQVLDRLLEITGLSARQFMIKLERGEFHMDGEGGGEGR